MTRLIPLDADTFVAGQIEPADMTEIAAAGVALVINNRPDHEEPGQPLGEDIRAAAQATGLTYRAVPVAGGLSGQQVEAMAQALDEADGKVLAFCRSGTRSTYLWALAQSRRGADADTLLRQAAAAGYDLTPIMRFL
jgi:uncharacterized protein (TIGR01244 family)